MSFSPSLTETWLFRTEEVVPVTRVHVIGGPSPAGVHEFATSRAVVGTSDQADLRLTDKRVSRLHCELVRQPDGIRLRDLGSKNGSWLAGQRVIDVVLGEGAEVRVGSTTLRMEVDRRKLPVDRWIGGDRFGALVGHGRAMQETFVAAGRAAASREPVLIIGEQGTGKELLARALHEAGPCSAGPLVVVDGSALGLDFADVELFGHVRGAFTGAVADRIGAFERASGGTLLLDHVDQLPNEVQLKLLRVLDTGAIRRLGDHVERRVDVRVIASSQRALEPLINERLFREDLYYRLAVLVIHMPPLRERPDDIGVIARVMLDELGAASADTLAAIEQELVERRTYPWPGNARELRSLVRRIVWLGRDERGGDEPTDVGPGIDLSLPFQDAKRRLVDQFERAYLLQMLAECDGKIAEAARRAGVNRTYYHRLLSKLPQDD